MTNNGPSLVAQQLRFCASNAGYSDSVHGRETKIPSCHERLPKNKLKVNYKGRSFFFFNC